MPRRKLTVEERAESHNKRLKKVRGTIELKRTNEEYRLKEALSKREYRKRKLHEPYENERKRFKRDFDLNSSVLNPHFEKLAEKFFKVISEGPIYVCYCCNRIWFKESINTLSKTFLHSKGANEDFISSVFFTDKGDTGEFCMTCYKDILKLKIPRLAVCNGFRFPEIPDCLKCLNPLEEKLVSCRLPFVETRPLDQDVLESIDVNIKSTVYHLPRNLDDIYIEFKHCSSTDTIYESIDPDKVSRAACYLLQNDIYKQSGIRLTTDWYKMFKQQNFQINHLIAPLEREESSNLNSLHNSGLCLKLEDNQIPLSFVKDPFFEEFAFPTLYGGKMSSLSSYLQRIHSELRRVDRRAARPDHVLYAYLRKHAMHRQRNVSNETRREKQKFVAAVRQFGLPSLLVKISAAETDWYDLIKCLSIMIDHHPLTRQEFETMNDSEKRRLLQKDPVISALYFDHKYRALMKTWSSVHGPFGSYQIAHSYYRIQFCQEDSPCAYAFLWLDKAPQYTPETIQNCITFIDEMMTCSLENRFIAYQTQNECFFPMDQTRILEPLKKGNPLRKTFKELKEQLSSYDDQLSFPDFLQSLDLSLDEYIDIIQSGINRTTVFLRRDVKEMRVCPYHPKMIHLMQSGMDIQFILDERTLNTYMNPLFALRSQVGVQEAAWNLLELPMSKCSEDEVFVPLENRRTKSNKVSIIDQYKKRPVLLENLCLAEFATEYSLEKKGVMKLLDQNNLYACPRKHRKILKTSLSVDAQNYYREQIMLYTHWREEWKDISSEDHWKIIYEANQSLIEKNRTKFILHTFENLFQETEEENESVPQANQEQRDILRHILYLSLHSNDPYYIFIHGPAGSGKSYLINLITQHLKPVYDRQSDPSTIKICKTAFTGKAAYHISGQTIHSAFGIPKNISLLPPLNENRLQTLKERYKDLRLIIIDEISMVGSRLFSALDQRLNEIMNRCDKPFGGVSLLVLGDLRQLKPIGDTPIYQSSNRELWDLFQFYELNEMTRHKNDSNFAQCLNRLVNGTMTLKDHLLLQSRVVNDLSQIPASAHHLFYTNKEVDRFNAERLSTIHTESCVVEAIDHVLKTLPKRARRYLLRKVRRMNKNETGNLLYEIILKLSVKYMLVCNINTSDGLVNGAVGILRKIEYSKPRHSKQLVVKRIWVEFEDENVGRTVRQKWMGYATRNRIHPRYTPIHRVMRFIPMSKTNPEMFVYRKQFPIQVAESITIHKAEGDTYPYCAVHLNPTLADDRTLQYVAFSRAIAVNRLYIVKQFLSPRPPSKNDPVMKELARLREERLIQTIVDDDENNVRIE